MISLPSGTRIWLVAGVTDMRKSFNGLGEQVQHVLNDNPFSGHLFIFRGRRGDTVKILWADADGLCLFTKRLEEGQFIWPAVQQQMKTLSRHSDTAKAFAYLLKQWDALNVYCSNGWVEIDNNIAENALRGVAVGRKNWMFAGSDSGGEHAAVLYSLIGTCRLNNVEPEKWLRYVIEHIQDWPANRVRDLLPWKVDLSSQ